MRSGSRRLVRVSPDDPGIARIRRGRGFAYRDPRGRAGVTRDLRGDGLSRARVLAGAFRLIDEALLRVGGERYARERGTVGLATLRVRHVEISGSVVTLAFPGKSGERW